MLLSTIPQESPGFNEDCNHLNQRNIITVKRVFSIKLTTNISMEAVKKINPHIEAQNSTYYSPVESEKLGVLIYLCIG